MGVLEVLWALVRIQRATQGLMNYKLRAYNYLLRLKLMFTVIDYCMVEHEATSDCKWLE